MIKLSILRHLGKIVNIVDSAVICKNQQNAQNSQKNRCAVLLKHQKISEFVEYSTISLLFQKSAKKTAIHRKVKNWIKSMIIDEFYDFVKK